MGNPFEILLGDCLLWLRSMPDNSVDSIVTDPPYGWSFMGKSWDYDIPRVEIWREALRVLKPGGHALIACGTRTQHRMACAVEDAGFEIRDCILWLHGQGFPKSLDISRAIDKAEGAVMTPATPVAIQWHGWGTALKPAVEIWTLARKPLVEKTVAENVQEYGTGALNIDGCRIKTEEILGRPQADQAFFKGLANNGYNNNNNNNSDISGGRFPANLILDETAAQILDAQTGELKSGTRAAGVRKGLGFNGGGGDGGLAIVGNSGGASRFFYCAKTSSAERGESKHPTMKPVSLMRYLCRLITPSNGIVLDPFTGSGSTGVAALAEGFRFLGVEMEREYWHVARCRVASAAFKAEDF